MTTLNDIKAAVEALEDTTAAYTTAQAAFDASYQALLAATVTEQAAIDAANEALAAAFAANGELSGHPALETTLATTRIAKQEADATLKQLALEYAQG